MRNTRLAHLLLSLKPKERELFRQLMEIGYLKAPTEVVAFFDTLKHQNYRLLKVEKKALLLAVFNSESERADQKLRQMMFILSNLVQEFIALQAFRKSQSSLLHYAAKGLAQRGLFKEFTKLMQKLIQQLIPRKLALASDYWRLMQYHRELFFHPETEKIKGGMSYIKSAMTNLDMAFVLAKLRLSCELITRESTLPEKHPIVLLDQAIQLGRQWASQNPFIDLYLSVLHLQRHGFSPAMFKRTKDLYFDISSNIPREEQLLILMYLINIIGKEITRGNHKCLEECLSLYKHALKSNILLKHKRMTYPTYTNIVAIGSVIEPAWTLQFIEQYKENLHDNYKDDAYAIAMAYWHFNQGQFDECHRALIQSTYLYIPYNFRIRSLYVRTFYELSNQNLKMEESLTRELENLYRFSVKYKETDLAKAQAYLNFYSFTRTLQGHRRDGQISRSRQKELAARLEDMAVSNRVWLEQKLKAIPVKR
ncbi:MAG: hypothetical protein AAF990_07090 [Bacteroidota bacterium]